VNFTLLYRFQLQCIDIDKTKKPVIKHPELLKKVFTILAEDFRHFLAVGAALVSLHPDTGGLL
jgi:hypothetical protein